MGAQDLIVALLAVTAIAWLVVRSRRRSKAGVCPGCNACPAAKAAGTAAPAAAPFTPAEGGLIKIEAPRS